MYNNKNYFVLRARQSFVGFLLVAINEDHQSINQIRRIGGEFETIIGILKERSAKFDEIGFSFPVFEAGVLGYASRKMVEKDGQKEAKTEYHRNIDFMIGKLKPSTIMAIITETSPLSTYEQRAFEEMFAR